MRRKKKEEEDIALSQAVLCCCSIVHGKNEKKTSEKRMDEKYYRPLNLTTEVLQNKMRILRCFFRYSFRRSRPVGVQPGPGYFCHLCHCYPNQFRGDPIGCHGFIQRAGNKLSMVEY